MRKHNPAGVAGPFATYSHGIELDGAQRFLFGAGQTGVAADGSVGDGIEAQTHLVWQNIRTVLEAADLDIADIVQLNMYLVNRQDYAAAAAIRETVLDGHRPASTLLYVAGLAKPEWLIEIDFIAARAAGE